MSENFTVAEIDGAPAVAGRLPVDALVTGGGGDSPGTPSAPTDLAKVVREYVLNGGSSDLMVDGSGGDVEFVFPADLADDITLNELIFVFSSDDLKFEGTKFGNENALTTGLLVEVTSGGVTTEIANILITEHFLEFGSPGGVTVSKNGKDAMVIGFNMGGNIVLEFGVVDEVKVTVRDDLDKGSHRYLALTVKGEKS